jgi:hypothetical protein
MHAWHVGSRWYILDLQTVTIDIAASVPLWHQGLYPSVEETGVKCYPRSDRFMLASDTNSLPVRCFEMGPKRWKSLVPIPPWTCDWLGHYDWEVMGNLSCGSNLMLSDTDLVGLLNEHLAGKWFETHANVKQAVTPWITVVTDFLHAGIQVWVPQWGRCLKIKG